MKKAHGLSASLSALAVGLALAVPGAAAAGAAAAPAGVITTIAGGNGGPALGPKVAVALPCGVAFGKGSVYVTEQAGNLVRRLSPGTGILDTMVGTGASGLDALPGSSPTLNAPCDIAVDAAGNLVFADAGNNVVRVAAARNGTFYGVTMLARHVYTVAGGGSAHGTPAVRASLLSPSVAVDRHGNLLVASQTSQLGPGFVPFSGSAFVQVVGGATGTFYGQKMVPGGIYAIAANACASFCQPGFAGDGGPATSALFSVAIDQIAVDASGNVLITDSPNNRVRVIAESSRTFYGQQMTAGDIYTIVGGGTGALGDGGPATDASLNWTGGVAVDAAGNVVVSDLLDNRVRLVPATSGRHYGQLMTAGDIYTIAGNGTAGFSGDKGPGVGAEVRGPAGAAVDTAGNVLIADAVNNRVRLVAARTGTFYGQQMTAGHIYTIAGNGSDDYSGDGGPATRAQFNLGGGPEGLAVGRAGIIVSDSGNNMVRVVAETNGVFYGQRFAAGNVYRVAGLGGRVGGFSGDGGPATRARFSDPVGAVVDAAGNILVSDTGNNRVRVIAVKSGRFYRIAMTAGHIYTVAGGGNSRADGVPATSEEIFPQGIAVDHSGNIVFCDNEVVRVVAEKTGRFYGQQMTAGDIYNVKAQPAAGAPGSATAVAVRVDHAGNLVVAGSSYVVVFPVKTGRFYGRPMTAGHYYLVAGNPVTTGFSGDGGPATKARLDNPGALAIDAAGNLLMADTGNNRIRVVAERTGTFYGKKMTAGDIYTVAGGGSAGYFSGDGGPATKAVLASPAGVAPFGTGLVVLDDGNNRVRAVSGAARLAPIR